MVLTNEQLALIDTLMYCRDITTVAKDSTLKDIVERLFYDGDSNINAFNSTNDRLGYSDSLKQVTEAILNDETLCNLKLVETSEAYMNDKGLENNFGVLALCFTSEGTNGANDLTVIYAGDYYSDDVDGDQLGWQSVFMGGMEDDTDGQNFALNFLNKMNEDYATDSSNITVSGHSAGGNYSQYVTILTNIVDKCFSFDGQGFSNEFIRKYGDEIAANASKISLYSSNTDMVNCLLNQISGCAEIKYFEANSFDTSKWGLMTGHLPYVVFNFDESGNLSFTTEGENLLFKIMNPTILTVINNASSEMGKESLENLLDNLSKVVYYTLNPSEAETDGVDIMSLLINVDTYHVVKAALPEIINNADLIADNPFLALIADNPIVNFILTKDTIDEVLNAFFDEDVADGITEMRADLAGITTELRDLVFLCGVDLIFGKTLSKLIGDEYYKYVKSLISELQEDVKQHFIDFFTHWSEGIKMIGEAVVNALDSFVDTIQNITEKVVGFFTGLFDSDDKNDAVIIGTNDNDELTGTDNDNVIYGNDGNDVIYAEGGNDFVFGGNGNDEIHGGAGDDVLFGDNDNDILYGDSGADKLFGGLGNDELHGGADNDELFGDDGDDVLYGDSGNDKLFGGDGNDELHGGSENDELFGGEGNDTLYGDDGDDYLEGGNGRNHMYGGEGNDTFVGGEDTDYMYGENGNDTFYGGNGPNYMYGGEGDDNFTGGEGYDYIEGGTGNDTMNGGNGFNEMYGQEGIDYIYGGNDKDYIDGGIGNDHLYGGNGENEIYGHEGNDTIYDGNDGSHIYGGTGNDTIYAGGGNDVIDPGEGDDYIQDDHGDDTIIFKAGYGTDTISDAAGNNTIELSGLSIEDAVMSKINGSDLKISLGSDNIIIKQYFDGAGFQNFNINGTMINDLITTLHGTDSDDWMSAWSDKGVTMNGEGGNDTLNGGNGDDVLEGGAGNDFLYGNSGNDTYIFSKDSGNDTIEDWNGSSLVKLTDINIDEVSVSKLNDSTLILTIDSTGDTLTINGYKWNQGGYTFEFADGTTDSVNKDTWKWESGFGSIEGEDTPPEQNIINGTSGDDNLYGTDNNDVFDGSAGNDILCGGNGEDTYIFAKGYEADTINEWGSDHSIVKLTDINSDEVTITDQWGSNLILSVNGTNDTLTISNFKWGQASYTFEFADGAVGTVNKDTWELELNKPVSNAIAPEISEEDIVQTNADILSNIYDDNSISSDLLTETDSTVISDVSDSASVTNETEETADQTDIQVMILTENMAAFGSEDNISDSMNVTDITDNSVMNQLLVGTQVQ